MGKRKNARSAYADILVELFRRHWKRGRRKIEFERQEIAEVAQDLGLDLPKNIGDVVYSFRYRRPLPRDIAETADEGMEWIIKGKGISRYAMLQVRLNRVLPREDLLATKIPDATPEIISTYAQTDEQSLLAKIRYNRLVDVFLSVTAYSLQNHLRTTVKGLGQIEIDEIYVAVDRSGIQYILPVQAKTGKDMHSVVQTAQDIACCGEKYPSLVCRPVSAQFIDGETIAMFELALEDEEVKVVQERHYRLVPGEAISADDLAAYRSRRT